MTIYHHIVIISEIGISQNQLAHAIGVPPNRIHHIVNGDRSITADTDLRLCRFFGLSEGYFLSLQNMYDLMEAKRSQKYALIEQIVPYAETLKNGNSPGCR